ncbi:unnamed protein product [Rotaria socialis]|uniref:G-protein coupled receptors family 1 profile domain-containing protein n=5 Tax=Rotaria socialis TaxID=392032 RepID=A0A821CQ89_9BILA|nr:unnamed protein product [Rotaria socialis]CAF4610669.1 unnamed protein product [Rotaria socialis]
MNKTSAIDLTSFLFNLHDDKNLTLLANQQPDENELLNSTITTITTTAATTIITTTTNKIFRLWNSSRVLAASRHIAPTTSSSSLFKKYFFFKSPFNRIMRIVELFILSLTLPCYAIVFILFIELTVQRINSNTAISGGGSRSRTQRRRQRMRSLIWTSNYLLVDFLGLLYELIYVIIHLTGDLATSSLAGRFYCQMQVYLPLYLTVLMAYSLTAISIYRRHHFMNLHSEAARSTSRSLFFIGALWTMPIITSIVPAYLLIYLKILRITQHEATNECQISYTYGSTIAAIYMCYRLGNIFLLPLSISFACYLTICTDLIRMQRRFTRRFERNIHIRKNLILQILFLFLNFAVFWLPAEIITLYTKSRLLKDTVQVTKSLNILLDPLIITGFDTRFSAAAQHFLSKWRLDEIFGCFSSHRLMSLSTASVRLPSAPTVIKLKRLKESTSICTSVKATSDQQIPTVTWNLTDNDSNGLESTTNHVSLINEQQSKSSTKINSQKKQRQKQQPQRRKRPQHTESTKLRHEPLGVRRSGLNQTQIKKNDNHLPTKELT